MKSVPAIVSRRLLAGVGALVVFGLATSAACAEGLLDLYNESLAHDPTLQSDRDFYNAQMMKYPEARAKWLPGVHLSGETLHGRVNQPDSMFPNYNSNGYTVGVTQTVFDWSALQDLKESEITVEQAGLNMMKGQNDLILRLASAFFDALLAQEVLRVSRQHIQTVTEQLALADAAFKAGHGTIVDVQDAQANLDGANADELEFESDLRSKLAHLSSIAGHPVTMVDPLSGETPALPDVYPDSEEAWTERAESENLDVRVQQLNISHAEHETSRYRYSHLPVISINAAYSRGNSNYIDGQDNYVTGGPSASTSRIGIQITIPLFDGMLAKSQLQESISLENKAHDDLSVVQQQASLDAQQAYLRMHGSFARAKSLYSAVASARLALESNHKAYESGIRLNSDVLAAADKVFQNERDLTQARVDCLLWNLKLKNAAGELSDADISSINDALSSEARVQSPPGRRDAEIAQQLTGAQLNLSKRYAMPDGSAALTAR